MNWDFSSLEKFKFSSCEFCKQIQFHECLLSVKEFAEILDLIILRNSDFQIFRENAIDKNCEFSIL